MTSRNRALALLTLCYPATPPAFVCGVQVCLGKSHFGFGLVVFYGLLLLALVECARHIRVARLAFGAALLATLVHVGLALKLIWGRGQDFDFEALLGTIFGVGFLVGLGGARLAWCLGRKVLSLGLALTSVCLALAGGGGALNLHVLYDFRPDSDPRLFLVPFFVQAVLIWLCRQPQAPAWETGPGLNQAASS